MKRIVSENQSTRVTALFLVFVFLVNDCISFASNLSSIRDMNRKALNRAFYLPFIQNELEKQVLNSVNIEKETEDKSSLAVLRFVAAASNPTSAESSGFSIGSTDGMVDKFTGDFSYSIPLMDVDGYPLVLSYNSNVGMMSEASWVGLGWDLNVGSISRDMRGIPDEFNGTQDIVRTFNQINGDDEIIINGETENAITEGEKYGGYLGYSYSFPQDYDYFIPGLEITALFGKYINPYVGAGKTMDISLKGQVSISDDHEKMSLTPNFSIGYSRDTKNGIGKSYNFGIQGGGQLKENYASGGISFGSSSNSRRGVIDKSFGLSVGNARGHTQASFSAITKLPFGTATSIPRAQFDAKTSGGMESLDLYAAFQAFGGKLTIGTILDYYDSRTDLVFNNSSTQQIYQPAYGYLHSGKRRYYEPDGKYPVMDYERTRDFEFSENMKNLSFSTQTFDVFSVNASGISGTFRAGRTDFGTFYDPKTQNLHNAASALLVNDDVSVASAGFRQSTTGLFIEVGYTTGTVKGKLESDNWKYGAENLLEFEEQTPESSSFDNTTYFKQVGEETPNDLDAYHAMSGSQPESFNVTSQSNEIQLTNQLIQGGTTLNNNLNTLTSRPIRATQFLPKLAEEYGSDVFYSYRYNSTVKDAIHRKDNTLHIANHISSIDVVSTDGTRYNYGIPVYSLQNSEVAFAVGDDTENYYGLSTYDESDNSINNDEGRDYYYDKTTMPAYPTAFLLTEMKSSDYIDRTSDGPSLDDIGNYYKFNYNCLYSSANPYTWRFPMSLDNNTSAFLNKGLQGTELDNMANYTIGQKEIWYLHSIETKNYIVEIQLNDPSVEIRCDGFGAQEQGQLDNTQALRMIKKIVLYNRNEKMVNPNAIPLQTVVFEYDQSLCKRTPSNVFTNSSQYARSGKLTLTGVRMYKGNSLENALKSYDFTYSSENPDFNYGYIDGWGNLKKDNLLDMKNEFYPYALQDEVLANLNASAWKLVKVENPQGGSMEIVYEADRYGYVQNKRAMRHLEVRGMTNLLEFLHIQGQTSWNGHSNIYPEFNQDLFDHEGVEAYLANLGYDSDEQDDIADILFKHKEYSGFYKKFEDVEENIVPNNVIIFPLEEIITSGTKAEADAEIKQKYFMQDNEQITELYFKTHVNIKENIVDLIPTFATIAQPCNSVFRSYLDVNENLLSFGAMPPDAGGNFRYGYVVLDLAVSGNKESGSGEDDGGIALHPLQKAALEFARMNLSDRVYGACRDCEGDLTVDRGAVFGADIYKRMILDANYAPSFDPERSLVRLYDADMIKFGGNARVKHITYKDNWNIISGEYLSSYSWTYVYEQDRPRTYGVAAFEPKQISDENPFYMWDSYLNFNKKFPDESKFNPTPITDALFPNPIVGYEEVRVFFEDNSDKGYSSSRFHTYKELAYVTREKFSDLIKIDEPAYNPLTGKSVSLFGLTQGYFVQTNNFHGKPHEMAVYDRNNNVQSRSRYHYYGLGEKVKTLDREGDLADENIAVEFDMHGDSRFVMNDNHVLMAGLEVALRIVPFAPIPLFKPKASITSREDGFYSNTLIKHINYSAVVKSIETETLGSINTAENLVYDRFSGNIIVSSLKDEFNDKLYSVDYPSHWYYDELKELTDMNGKSVQLTLNANGSFSQTNHILTPGDVVKIGSVLYRVAKEIFDTDDNSFFLMKENGEAATFTPNTYNCTIIDCHRDNRLVENMQSITTKKSPFSNGFTFPTDEIISATSLTYRDKLNVRCGEGCHDKRENNNEVELNTVINPYQYGVRGDLVIDGRFAWQSERLQDQHNYGTRFDGTYADFKPFYSLGTANKWFKITQAAHPDFTVGAGTQKWRKFAEVTLFDSYGNPLESRNQVDVFSSVLYGYNSTFNLVPVASAVNARMQDIAFDGFEDYLYYLDNCQVSQGHFDYKDQIGTEEGVSLDHIVRHSGLNSLKINSDKEAIVTRALTANCVTVDEYEADDNRLKDNVFEVESCDCIKSFDPTPGRYIVGLWVKKDENSPDAGVQIKLSGTGMTSLTYEFKPEDQAIEGWQRIEGEFVIPEEADMIKVVLFNNTPLPAYFDDVRLHPFLAGMTTVVYDPNTLLPLATHDGYNYTTFYNYDENLHQSRIKVETVEGIKTMLESEQGGKIKY